MQIGVFEAVGASQALGHIIASQFEMEATWPSATGAMHFEVQLDLIENGIELTRFEAAFARERIAVHRITHPQHRVPGVADSLNKSWKPFSDLASTHPADKRQSSRYLVWIKGRTQPEKMVKRCISVDFATDWVPDATEELNMCAVAILRPSPDP